MTAILRTTVTAAAVCLMATRAFAADGVLIVQKLTFGATPPQTYRMQIEQKRMRTQTTGADGKTAGIMFDGTRQVMTIIDDGKKTYIEVSKADLEAFTAQMSGMMAQMQEMVKNAPPAQKAQMEAALKGRMGGAGGAAAAKVEYRKTGTATVGKWTCDKYEGYTNGQKTQELCTVDPKVLGFTPADFQVTRDQAEFFKQFQQMGGGMASQQPFAFGTPEQQGFSGVPVRSVITVDGSEVISELVEASRQTFPDSTFQVPAGYQKNDLMGGRGRRGR